MQRLRSNAGILRHVELLSLNNRLVLSRLARQILAAHGTS